MITMVPGTKYRVTFDDCCAKGFFEDVFVRYESASDDPDPDYNEAVFRNAHIVQLWGVKIEEAAE
jgi:hypothetical protein